MQDQNDWSTMRIAGLTLKAIALPLFLSCHDIDITDFNALATNFNPELKRLDIGYMYKTVRQGDFNGDWRIDITDFNVLSDNFAPSGYAGPFDAPSTSAVPEPSSLLLALLGLMLLTGVRGQQAITEHLAHPQGRG